MPNNNAIPTPPGPRPPAPGPNVLGPYRLEALLGRGGMSAVYRAIQTSLDRPVALKLLPSEFANDPTFIARFLQEARAAAALQHPHIIPIYDSGQVDGRYYIAMRYVDGLPLARAIPADGLSVQRAIHIVEQIASALDYAHARGVVHRDVSAGNVMLEAGDRVTLMDFGIAQAREGSRLTRAGVAVGTLEYLSPEQARGEIATAQSDIYSLGVLTYELLSGTLPFNAADDRGLLLQHLNAPPPSIRRQRPDIPPGIDNALQRCMAKDPAARFLSAAAFVTALHAALTESRRQTTVMASPGGPPRAVAPAVRGAASSAPKQPDAARVVPPQVAASTARPTLVHHRRVPRWLSLATLLLLLALAGLAYAQRGVRAIQSTSVGTAPAPTRPSRAVVIASSTALHSSASAVTPTTATPIPPTATAVPPAPPVHPALPQDAVQGFYVALNRALQNGHDAAGMAAAYAYLSPTAQFQLPFADFQRQYAAVTSLVWAWRPPLYAADQQSASVSVGLTAYGAGGNASSNFDWVAVIDGANGWHLDHMAAAASAAPLLPSANSGNGKGKGHKGD